MPFLPHVVDDRFRVAGRVEHEILFRDMACRPAACYVVYVDLFLRVIHLDPERLLVVVVEVKPYFQDFRGLERGQVEDIARQAGYGLLPDVLGPVVFLVVLEQGDRVYPRLAFIVRVEAGFLVRGIVGPEFFPVAIIWEEGAL